MRLQKQARAVKYAAIVYAIATPSTPQRSPTAKEITIITVVKMLNLNNHISPAL